MYQQQQQNQTKNINKTCFSGDALQIVILPRFMIQKNKHPMRVCARAITYKKESTKYIQVPF